MRPTWKEVNSQKVTYSGATKLARDSQWRRPSKFEWVKD